MFLRRYFFLAAAVALVQGELLASQANSQNTQTISERVPAWVFGKNALISSPVLSPDGSKIAVMLSRDGQRFLGIIDLNNPKASPEFIASNTEFRDAGDRSIGSTWTWVGNETLLFSLESRERIFGQRIDIGRLVAYDVTTKKKLPLAWENATGDASRILWLDHDSGQILLQRQSIAYGQESWTQPEVVRVDTKTGKFSIEMRPNPIISRWIADSKGVVRAGTGSSSETGKDWLVYRSDGKGTMKTVISGTDRTFTGTQVSPEIFLDEPDMAIVSTNRSGFRRLYKANLKSLELIKPVFERAGYDVSGAVASLDGNQMIGATVYEEGPRVFWFEKDWQAIQQVMEEQFGVGNARISSVDRKAERLVFHVGKPSQPGAYYLFDTRTGKLVSLGWRDGLLTDMTINPVSTVHYTARDGLSIPTVVTMPRHRVGQKNLPVIVMPHGGPFGVRDHERFEEWSQTMAEAGYVVLQPNYRGSGGYGKQFVMKGRAKDGYGMRMQDDLNDALTWFGARGIVDPKRACVMGWSYGGYAAARGAQRDPDVWKCAIAGAGIYDMSAMKRYDEKTFGEFGAGFQSTVDDLNAISAINFTNAKWAPLLVVAGLRDDRIPISQSRSLIARMKASGKKESIDFEYIEQKQGTHHLPYEDVHIQWLEASEQWATRFNPPYIDGDQSKPVPLSTRFGVNMVKPLTK